MASALAVDARAEGAGSGRLSAAPTGHTGVYRLARVEGRSAKGSVAGMLFLREDRSCVLRLVVPADGDRKLIRLLRGIWWPVPEGIKTLTSDGSVGVWAASGRSVTVGFPLGAPGSDEREAVAQVRFVRVR